METDTSDSCRLTAETVDLRSGGNRLHGIFSIDRVHGREAEGAKLAESGRSGFLRQNALSDIHL
jgi:hypothetical protein